MHPQIAEKTHLPPRVHAPTLTSGPTEMQDSNEEVTMGPDDGRWVGLGVGVNMYFGTCLARPRR